MSTLVARIIEILDAVSQSESGIGVNKIVKATGESKRKSTIELIKELRKNGLLERANKQGQLKLMRLTAMGAEIRGIKKDCDTILQAFDELPKVMREYLVNSKADPETIFESDRNVRNLYGFLVNARHDFPFYFISTLLSRYFAMVYRYNPSKRTLQWLNQIVIEAMLGILSNRSHHIRTFELVTSTDHETNDPAAISTMMEELTDTWKNQDYLGYLRPAFKHMKASKIKEVHHMQILAAKFFDSFNSLWEPVHEVTRNVGVYSKYDERDGIWIHINEIATKDESKRQAVTAAINGLYQQLSLNKRGFSEGEIISKLLEIPSFTDETAYDYFRWALHSSLIYHGKAGYIPAKPMVDGHQSPPLITSREFQDILNTLAKKPEDEIEESLLIQALVKTGKLSDEKDILDCLFRASVFIYESRPGYWRRYS